MALLIAGLTLALFWSGTRYDFVNLDDDLYVQDNPHLKSQPGLKALAYAFTTSEGGSWMPLTWLSYLVDAAVWKDKPSGYHATNIVLHALAAALLFVGLRMLTRDFWPSAFTALLFAVHPLRLESVLWIAERKDVLSGLCFMLVLIAYARYGVQPARNRMMATALCLLLGLMAKPMLVTTPLLLLLLDFWPLRRLGRHGLEIKSNLRPLLLEKLPLIAMCLLFAAVTLATQSASGAVAGEADTGLDRLWRVADNYVFYLGKVFWPQNLNVLYPISVLTTLFGMGGLALLLGVSVAAIRLAGSLPELAVGWFWFLISLLPVIGFVPIGSTWVADRYTYLPSIGLGVALAWTGRLAVQKFPRCKIAAFPAGFLLLAVLAVIAARNLPRWQNSLTLFTDAVSKGAHPGARLNLGVALAARGEHEAAIGQFTLALELDPQSAEACYNRANAWQMTGATEQALADFSRAIELKPAFAEAWNNRGSLRAARGELEPAITDFSTAIGLRSDYADALANRGRAFMATGRPREAIADYSAAISLKPDFAAAYHDRGVAFFQLQDYGQAWADIRACRRLGLTPNPELLRRLEAVSEQSH